MSNSFTSIIIADSKEKRINYASLDEKINNSIYFRSRFDHIDTMNAVIKQEC